MGARELYDAGDLSGAIAQLTQDVRSSPRDLRSRTFLFELLCFAGDFGRAERQLDAIAQMSEATADVAVQVYRNAMVAEKARHEFFAAGVGQPKFLLEAPVYAGLMVEAAARVREDRPAEAEDLIEKAGRMLPAVKGDLDGTLFEDLRDCDDLLAPFLEVISHRDYVWLPFEQLKKIEIQAPRTLRDLFWLPATLELRGGALIREALLPVQYHGSNDHPDDLIKLGRMTDWKSLGERFVRGIGQRMLLVDNDERPLPQVRKIEIAAPH